jgi:methyl-accepting chemotaxis protein
MQFGRVTLRIPRLSLPARWFARHVGRMSVRSRIIVLALIPVVGFLANGMTYVSGEEEVGQSFKTVNRAHELAEASREFKIAIAAMRIAAKDFAVSPHGTLIDTFIQSHESANADLNVI